MSQTDEEEASEFESYVIDPESFESDAQSALASKIALLAANCPAPGGEESETQARLEALLEAAGIGKLSTTDGKAFADPEVLRRLSSSVSCALDEAAAALSKMKTDSTNPNEPSSERTLVEACSEGDVSTVRKLLVEGRSANETTEDGESLLSLACSAGYFELAEVLLTMHANVEDVGKGECTPLMEAASGGYLDIVELLLAHGADVNAASNAGNTALTYACCGGYVDVVKTLIDHGADLECHNENGHTPLMEAASSGHVRVAALLLERGAGINTHSNEFKESALTLACYKGHLEMVNFLLQAGTDQEQRVDEMHTALMEASMDGHVEVARLLLDSGAQVNMPADSFESPLTLAACGGHVDLAELLIERGAAMEEINDEGYTPLMEASREGHEELVVLLLSKGANVNAKTEETQETPLSLACCGGFLDCAEVLLRAGADLEGGGTTPLMEASQEGQLELVKFLIQEGAKVNVISSGGDTALSLACEHGHTDVADYLLSVGAELELETDGGRTPLMKAARAGHLCTVQFLISRGADVNRKTKDNEHTVLSLACLCGHLPVVELLLCQGADPTVKLKDGSNMLLEASKGGHTTVVQLLLDYPHNFVTLPVESSQVVSPTPEPLAPRVPTQSLPMVVPPPEPDQAPELPLVGSCDHHHPADLGCLATDYDLKLPSDAEATTNHLQALHQQQLQYYQQHAAASGGLNDLSNLNPAALVSQFIQQGNHLSQTAADLQSPESQLALDKDVKVTVESFLRTMATETAAANKTRPAEFNAEEAQGKLTELEQRIKEAIEKNAQLKSIEAMQVERELQVKTQQKMKEEYLNLKQEEVASSSRRGKPDGVEDAGRINQVSRMLQERENAVKSRPAIKQEIPQTSSLADRFSANIPEQSLQPYPPSTKLKNGASGSLSQPAKSQEDHFFQCSHHPCTQLQHPLTNGFVPPPALYPQPHLDINCHSEDNNDTPLTLAAASGFDTLVQLLVARGANTEHRDKKGFTPLILAATGGHPISVRTLLEANADLEATSDRTKDTPLSLACSGGKMEVVELLLQRGANKEHRNVSDYTPLSLAASGGYVNVIKLLLSHGAEINSRTGSKLGISPLMLAAMNGHTQAVQLLLDMGADINAQIETNRNTALTLACFQGRHEVVSLLVDRKANVEHRAKTGLTPLMEAASGGYAEVGRVLLDKGADPNAAPVPSSRDTALTIAADKGHYRFCDLILSRGALVEVKNKKGNTPLWLACNGGYLEVVMLLVAKGADVNAADNRSVTPLMAGFRKGHGQVVRWLAKEVSQFPSDNECMRYIATISDRELLKRTHQCMECIVQAKELHAQEANKFASELLEELDLEKIQLEDRKERAARKREKRKMKRKLRSTKKGKDDVKEEKGTVENKEEAGGEVTKTSIADVVISTNDMKIADACVSTSSFTTIYDVAAAVSTLYTTAVTDTSTISTFVKARIPLKLHRAMLKTSTPVSAVTETDFFDEAPAAYTPIKEKQRVPEIESKAFQTPLHTDAYLLEMLNDSCSRSNGGKKTRRSNFQESLTANRASSATKPHTSRATASSLHHYTTSSASKRPQRRDEGWKEVITRKSGNSSGGKRIMVASNLISRVIGRGGCNINAIREVTGAHIDIDKQRKGGQERNITIKGSPDVIKHAQQLITSLISEDKTDHEISDIIARAQAQAAQNQALKTKQTPQKAAMTVVAAPIPSKPAWTVPPSIVAQSNWQSQRPVSGIAIKVGVWVPPVNKSASSSSNNASSTSTKSWAQPTTLKSPPTSSSSSSVESVKQSLFMDPPIHVMSTPSVNFTPKSTDKPVQPVAPMVSIKAVTSAYVARVSHSSYGPIGSGSPTQHQVHPTMPHTQHPIPLDHSSRSNAPASHAHTQASTDPNHVTHQMLENIAGPSMLTSGSVPVPHNRVFTCGPSHAIHPGAVSQMVLSQEQNMRGPALSNVGSPSSNVSVSLSPAQPQSGHSVNVTPVRSIQASLLCVSSDDTDGMSSGYGSAPPEPNHQPSQTYSPFSNSYKPSAGASSLWNESGPVSGYQSEQSTKSSINKLDSEDGRNTVDQSKAPGYRGNMKSPSLDNGTILASANQASAIENSPQSTRSQSSPSAADGENSSKQRPIGTERAHQRRVNPMQPHEEGEHRLPSSAAQDVTNIWYYDKLNPAQITMEHSDPRNYGNWSPGVSSGRNDGIMTTVTANKPQVTASELPSSPKTPTVEQQSFNPPVNPQVMNTHFYPAVPHGFNVQSRMDPGGSHFPQPSNAGGGVGTQPPIGSHLGGNNGMGIVGPQQQQSTLQPIGSHLSAASHIRSNAYQHGQMQRSFPPAPAVHQQPPPGPRYHVPFYMQQQTDMSRFIANVGSDVNWQQPPSMYGFQARHPNVNPYQPKNVQDIHGGGRVYGAMPSYSNSVAPRNMNQAGVVRPFSNSSVPVTSVKINPAFPMQQPQDNHPGFMRENQYYEPGNEYMLGGVVPNNYGNPAPNSSPNWDQNMCRAGPGYQTINSGNNSTQMVGTPHHVPTDSQQGWNNW